MQIPVLIGIMSTLLAADSTVNADELAQKCDTIPYEIMLGFSPRVRRAWED